MKRFLLLAIIAILVVGGSTFAYTYTTATASIGVTAIESDFATVTTNVTAMPPQVFGKFTSTWPSGTLFNIEPHSEYSGDLVIRVSLVNAGQLLRHYQHSNMSLELQDSTDNICDEQGSFQLLNLDNAEVEFLWENDSGTPPYKIVLTGGSFSLHQWKSITGGSVQPQLYCEVTQR